MSEEKLIHENWSDYDDRKIRDGRDARYFSCEESWEVDYLIDKIVEKYPDLDKGEVWRIIMGCCRLFGGPHPREEFVDCVLKGLKV